MTDETGVPATWRWDDGLRTEDEMLEMAKKHQKFWEWPEKIQDPADRPEKVEVNL